ncbi:MAG: hypothetical protein WA738_05600 [Candidatus Angelobacter sp.]
MKLEIPYCPPSLNEVLRYHWTQKSKLKDCWQLHILCALGLNGHLKPIVKMRCKITLYHSRLFDKDNAYGACKVVVDALKSYRLIWDDTPEYLDLTVEQAKSSRKEARTVIELEAV